MNKKLYIKEQLHELLYQFLETERGGIKIYETAQSCAQNEDLKHLWQEYLEHILKREQLLPQRIHPC